MHRCLDLAQLGRGGVGNGALVGAVLVRDDRIIAEGYHEGYGMPHAERMLLESFNKEVLPDDVLYVNLEPCCHVGKAPPCTNILIERNVRTVVYGMQDPDPRVAGKGIAALWTAGIESIGPFERALCERVNKGFSTVRREGRPWITLKMAKDGAERINMSNGSSLKITSQEQDAWSHTFLRAGHDAILVGIGTVISDDPSLNIRFDQKKAFSHSLGLNETLNKEKNSIQPYKIILDSSLAISMDAKVVQDDVADRTLVITSQIAREKNKSKIAALERRGVSVRVIPLAGDYFEWQALWKDLLTPRTGFDGITSMLVEGGQKTWDSFMQAGVIDEHVILRGH